MLRTIKTRFKPQYNPGDEVIIYSSNMLYEAVIVSYNGAFGDYSVRGKNSDYRANVYPDHIALLDGWQQNAAFYDMVYSNTTSNIRYHQEVLKECEQTLLKLGIVL